MSAVYLGAGKPEGSCSRSPPPSRLLIMYGKPCCVSSGGLPWHCSSRGSSRAWGLQECGQSTSLVQLDASFGLRRAWVRLPALGLSLQLQGQICSPACPL